MESLGLHHAHKNHEFVYISKTFPLQAKRQTELRRSLFTLQSLAWFALLKLCLILNKSRPVNVKETI